MCRFCYHVTVWMLPCHGFAVTESGHGLDATMSRIVSICAHGSIRTVRPGSPPGSPPSASAGGLDARRFLAWMPLRRRRQGSPCSRFDTSLTSVRSSIPTQIRVGVPATRKRIGKYKELAEGALKKRRGSSAPGRAGGAENALPQRFALRRR